MVLMPIVMLLPIIGLPIFWILTFGEAIPIYLFFVSLSAGMMWVMHRAMKSPRMTGSEFLMGKTGEVVSNTRLDYVPPYMIWILGELWSADQPPMIGPPVS